MTHLLMRTPTHWAEWYTLKDGNLKLVSLPSAYRYEALTPDAGWREIDEKTFDRLLSANAAALTERDGNTWEYEAPITWDDVMNEGRVS